MGNTRRIKRTASKNARRRAAAATPVAAKRSSSWWKWALGGALALGGILLVVFISVDVTSNPQERPDPPVGVEVMEVGDPSHTTDPIAYPTDPPAGGPHDPTPLRCQAYDEPVRNENAVHALEHGAVWVAYDPEQVEAGVADELRGFARQSEVIVSPYPNLEAPVIAVSWGRRLLVDDPADDRLDAYVRAMKNRTAPEAAASC